MGTVIGLIFFLIILGVLWWALVQKLWPLVAPYVGEPFNTFIYILIVVLFVVIVLYVAAQLLALAGIHVNTFGFGRMSGAGTFQQVLIPQPETRILR